MLVMSRQDRERLGLAQVLDGCACRTPQGRRLKMKHRYYGPKEGQELQEELQILERLTDYARHHPGEISKTEGHLAHFRDLRATASRLHKGDTLDVTELFELKQTCYLVGQLMKQRALLDRAGIRLIPLDEAANLLDPGGFGGHGFYLYDDYSPQLAALRQARTQVEIRMKAAGGEVSDSLLAERDRLRAAEADEELAVRADLSARLAPFAASLATNLDAVGELDFRLAKAGLALKWGASRPQLVEPGGLLILEKFFHPAIEAQLAARGTAYERQTVAIARGTTILTGANMGGKSVSLKALALSVILVHLGYFPPAAYAAVPLFDFVSYSSDHVDSTRRGLSTFASEMIRIRNDLDQSIRGRGMLVLDEPFRGTNPEEATALVTALSRLHADLPGVLVMATHYRVPAGAGIRHLRLRGVQVPDLEAMAGDTGDRLTDQEAVRRIEALMDYSIEPADDSGPAPAGALRLAEWLGLDPDFLRLAKDAKEEESWQS